MKDTLSTLNKLLSSPTSMFWIILGISVMALGAAITAELVYGLEPCILCIYQRVPFVVAIILSFIGLALPGRMALAKALLGLCALAFFLNTAFAIYHTGVEQHLWMSAVEGCAVPADFGTGKQSMLENILSAPSARCDEIAWKDPVLGLSMANYNIVLNFGMFIFCLAGAARRRLKVII